MGLYSGRDGTSGFPTTVSNIGGTVSTLNSTATPLGIGATFTGNAEEVKDISTISIFVFSNVASATDGLIVEWSSDGINWDDDDVFTIPASNGKFYTFGPEARYFRVRFVNGAIAQSSFRLQAILHPLSIKPSSHRVDAPIVDSDDAELTKSVITGKTNTGTYVNVGVTGAGSIQAANLVEAELERGTLFTASINRDSTGLLLGVEDVALLRNDGSTYVRIYSADLNYPANSEWELYLNPITTANGTAQTTRTLRTDSISTTNVVLYNAPTVTSSGGLLYAFQVSASSRFSALPGTIILAPGHRLLLRRITTGGGSKIGFNIQWGSNNV